jgi:flagellar protein FlaI
MASGHASLSTFHAGSLDTVIKRLTTPPIELSPTLLESLNTVVIMAHTKEKGKSARRIKEVVEIEGVDPKTDEVKTNIIFKWDPSTDSFEKINDSVIVRRIVTTKGGKYEDAMKEIEDRVKILKWMQKQGIKDFLEFSKTINLYYKEPMKLLARVEGRLETLEKPIETEILMEKPTKKRMSILELLGFRLVKEK